MKLQDKINYSIELLQKMERSALTYSVEGYHLAFSGGKDSQVIYELAKMAGVKFQAYFYKTSVDPKELLSFIRLNYPDVIWIKPQKTMFQLIESRHSLPTRKNRFCCEYIKERNGLNQIVVIGIRKTESNKRSKRLEFTTQCKLGCDKILLSIILDWTDKDVWQFLKMRGLTSCDIYKYQKRIGCIGCPCNRSAGKELVRHPNIRKAYVNTLQKVIEKNPECSLSKNFIDGEDALMWWTSNKSISAYKC